MTVNVSDELDARVSGVGAIWYIGSPKLISNVSGVRPDQEKGELIPPTLLLLRVQPLRQGPRLLGRLARMTSSAVPRLAAGAARLDSAASCASRSA